MAPSHPPLTAVASSQARLLEVYIDIIMSQGTKNPQHNNSAGLLQTMNI